MSKKKQSKEVKPDFSPTPLQKMLWMTHYRKSDPQKVKKEFIKLFGTEKIRIASGKSLDEFVNEWCREYSLKNLLVGRIFGKRCTQLIYDLVDLPNLYTEGQRKVWFKTIKKVEN